MGAYFLRAYGDGEFPKLLPWMVIIMMSVIIFNLLADVMYAVLDPRIRLED
jgi:peptide/nickel transport system permease protein